MSNLLQPGFGTHPIHVPVVVPPTAPPVQQRTAQKPTPRIDPQQKSPILPPTLIVDFEKNEKLSEIKKRVIWGEIGFIVFAVALFFVPIASWPKTNSGVQMGSHPWHEMVSTSPSSTSNNRFADTRFARCELKFSFSKFCKSFTGILTIFCVGALIFFIIDTTNNERKRKKFVNQQQ